MWCGACSTASPMMPIPEMLQSLSCAILSYTERPSGWQKSCA